MNEWHKLRVAGTIMRGYVLHMWASTPIQQIFFCHVNSRHCYVKQAAVEDSLRLAMSDDNVAYIFKVNVA